MDPDLPVPSIEGDQNNRYRDAWRAATETPLPASSPTRSPQRSPSVQRHVPSPSRKPSTPSLLNPDRRPSAPLLNHKHSSSSLRNYAPSPPSRRSSTVTVASLTRDEPPAPPPTAASIARNHFRAELDAHPGAPATKTVIVIHDACYGHRFSRPRATKAQLSTIVERPERILAGVVGLATAYVRLGERHKDGQYAPKHGQTPSATPPFKIHKTNRRITLASAAATHIHGQKWMEELRIMCETAESKLAANGKELVRPEGMQKEDNGTPRPKLHEGDLYLCSESLNALEGCLGGVCEGIDSVFGPDETRRAFVCIRPPGHHCSSDFPSGFCWLNNVHVGIAHAAMDHGLTHAAIIDFDLHHGDGSQSITWDHNERASTLPKNVAAYKKTPIGYYSLHDINSYPCELGDREKVQNASLCIENAHGQSVWNVHLEPWRTHQDFWDLYETRYVVLLDKARAFLRHHAARLSGVPNGPKPKAAIFLSAGFDASEWEGAGMQRHKVNVPTDFYARFTADVVKLSEEEGLGVDGRVISVLEGGYSDRALTSGILSHVCGLACGSMAPSMMTVETSLDKKMEGLQMNGGDDGAGDSDMLKLDTDWWAPHSLEAIEALMGKGPAPPPPSKPKDIVPGNYSSPTHASVARSLSASHGGRQSFSGEIGVARQMSPKPELPLPEVDWATAAVELSKLIVPTDRPTVSCRHDELNAEATRARKARQSVIGLPATDSPSTGGELEPKMQLRERRTRLPAQDVVPPRAASRVNRRKTFAAVPDLGEDSRSETPDQSGYRAPSRSQRRVSDASSIISGFSNMQIGDNVGTSGSASKRSSRESSVVSGRKAAPPKAPVVKKVRPAPTATRTKPPASGGTSPKRGGDIPSLPRASSSSNQPLGIGQRERKPSVTVAAGAPRNPTTRPSDVDDLASSVGKLKINLKVPSPEENAAREKERSRTLQKEKKPRAPRKPAVPKATKSVLIKKESSTTGGNESATKAEELGNRDQKPVAVDQSSQPDSIVVAPPTSATSQGYVDQNLQTPNTLATAAAAHSGPREPSNVPTAINKVDNQASDIPARIGQDAGPVTSSVSNSNIAEKQVQPDAHPHQRSAPDQASTVTGSKPYDPVRNIPENHPTALDIQIPQNNQPLMPPPATLPLPRPASPSMTSPPFSPITTNIKRTKADLPRFTSSSPIPFSKPSSVHSASSHDEPSKSNQRPPTTSNLSDSNRTLDRVVPFATSGEGSFPGIPKPDSPTDEASIRDVPEPPRQS